jgi:hypothetical protein
MKSIRRNATWRGVAAVAVLGFGLATSASADTITFNPLGTGATGAITGVNSFNFSFGSAVAVGAATLTDGQTFQLLYQSALTSYNGTSTVINDSRLNAAGGYQVTEVASFFEVAHINPTTGAITFTLAPGQPSNVSIYDQALGATGPTYSFTSGTGFTNGTLIYSATVTGDQSTFQPTGSSTAVGQGQTFITASGSSNAGYFVSPPVVLTTFQGAVTAPYFTGSPPPVVNGHTVTSSDLSLQVSAGVESFAVPEPASMAMGLMAIAIAPLVSWQVRRRRARA